MSHSTIKGIFLSNRRSPVPTFNPYLGERMAKTTARLYDTFEIASQAVRQLEDAGIPPDDISVIANKTDGKVPTAKHGNEAVPGAEIGAGAGALAGGSVGVLAGLGMLAIPGVGPVVAAGWLVALAVGAAGGAAAGGLLGGLIGSGISKEHAEVYAEGVRRGGTLVSVRTAESDEPRVAAILEHNAVDPVARRAEYASAGWKGYNPDEPI